MTTTYPQVMQRDDASVDDFPDHANVLAVVSTYQEQYGPMPWLVLLDVMESLPSISSGLQLSKAGRRVEAALLDITTDLRSLGFVELTAAGTISTSKGDRYIEKWNGKFTARKELARTALGELRFERFVAQ